MMVAIECIAAYRYQPVQYCDVSYKFVPDSIGRTGIGRRPRDRSIFHIYDNRAVGQLVEQCEHDWHRHWQLIHQLYDIVVGR